jgi:hypothetical protein
MVSYGANIFFGGDFFHVNGKPARVGKVNAGGGDVAPLPTTSHVQQPLHGGKILALAFVSGADVFLYAGGTFEERAVRWKLARDGDSAQSAHSDQQWQYEVLQATSGPIRAILPAFSP